MENDASAISLKDYVRVLGQAPHYEIDPLNRSRWSDRDSRRYSSKICPQNRRFSEVFVPMDDIALIIYSGVELLPQKDLWVQDGYLAFNFSLAGGRECAIGPTGETHILRPGKALILNYGDGHVCYQTQPVEISTSIRFYCTPAALELFSGVSQSYFLQALKALRSNDKVGAAVLNFVMDASISELLQQMATFNQASSVLRQLYLRAKLAELIYHVARCMEAPEYGLLALDSTIKLYPREIESLHKVRHQIEIHLDQPPTLEELSKASGLNINKMTAGFKQLFGASIHQYGISQRLNEARRLLKTGRYTVSAVAEAVGYRELSSFSRMFRSRFGVPPKDI